MDPLGDLSKETIRMLITKETKGEQIGERIGIKNGLENKEGIEENIEGMTKGKKGDETTKRRKILKKPKVNGELEESLLDTYT